VATNERVEPLATPPKPEPRWRVYGRLMRLNKPIGTLLLLWPTLWALFVASAGEPSGYHLFAFSLGTLLMRSAGCVINDYADRDFDKHVARTKDRPITAGLVSGKEALTLFAVLCTLAAVLLIPLSGLTWALALVAVFLAVSYPFTKRFFALPQAYLGIAFGFGIPMAFAEVQGEIPLVAWVMLAANICWALAYDTEYAMVDREDDLKIGLKTAAITFGRFDILAVAFFYTATLLLMVVVGELADLDDLYFLSLMVAGGIALYHLWLIRKRDPQGCFKAFNHNNWFGAVVFVGLCASQWF
jgi:4-hydroxybenzoate polyprenyltransferase